MDDSLKIYVNALLFELKSYKFREYCRFKFDISFILLF